jgi:hypothetical protein
VKNFHFVVHSTNVNQADGSRDTLNGIQHFLIGIDELQLIAMFFAPRLKLGGRHLVEALQSDGFSC